MTPKFFVLFALCLVPAVASAQNNPVQMRLPIHVQAIAESKAETKDRFGLALWGVLPDVNAPKSNLTTFLVGGLLWQHNKKNWVELMGGARLNQNGYKDPVLNLRFVSNQVPRLTISGELLQSFRKEKRRFLGWAAVDTATGIWKIRAGVETENIHFFGKTNSVGLGPRVVAPLPWKLPNAVKVSMAATYQFRNDKNFVRVYLVTNLSFGR